MRRALAVASVLAVTTPALADERGPYVHGFGTLALGESLRLNNPFRLPGSLGKSQESVSLASPYVDVGFGATLGAPSGLQHGLLVHASFATSGIPQTVVTPSYVALLRLPTIMPYARAGLPFVLTPTSNVGGEIALGGIYPLTGVFALTAELGASGFYGAATREVSATFVPLIFGQVGVAFDLEVLP
jgi:hypothetical protein